MTSLLSKTAPNYQTKEGDINSLYVPQPFLNYGGLTKMMSSDYRYIPKESPYLNIPQQNQTKKKFMRIMIHFMAQEL